MPTSFPFPTLARLALSLYASARKIERLPTILEVQPWQRAEIVPMPAHLNWGSYLSPMLTLHDSDAFEGI